MHQTKKSYNIKNLSLTKLPYALKMWLIKRNEFFDRTAIAQAACSFLFLSSEYHRDTISCLLHDVPVSST